MRMVYEQERLTRFKPRLGELRQLLPHVSEVELKFVQPSATKAFMDTDLTEIVKFTFVNGATLNIEGSTCGSSVTQ